MRLRSPVLFSDLPAQSEPTQRWWHVPISPEQLRHRSFEVHILVFRRGSKSVVPFFKKFEICRSVSLFLLVDQVTMMDRVGEPTAIACAIPNNCGARMFDHKLTAE